MAYIGQIELTKKKPPKVETDTRAWADLYDTLNHLIDSVNSKSTTEQRRPGDLHNSIGDIKVFKDKTDNKYYMETMTEDGSAKREMFISDKDVRSGEGFYSTSSAIRGGGTGGTADTRNIEQQLFEAVPWTGGTPNNITVDSDGKLVTDTVAGAIVSNNYIVQADLVGSGKTWAANQKPNLTTIDNDGKIVLDEVEGATVSNSNIVAANIVGGGKPFTTKPPVTFKQDGIPTSLTVGDLWYDTNDGNKLYIAESVGADEITGGEWVATVDATIATAQSAAETADGKAVVADGKAVVADGKADDAQNDADTGIANAATADGKAVAAQSTADSALSTANGKNKSFYQDAVPTAVKAGDMWFDTDDEYKMYRAAADGSDAITSGEWEIVNAVPTLNAIAINASQITAGYIEVGRINTASIASAEVSAGNITAAGTITGSTFQTASSGQRIAMSHSDNTLRFYDGGAEVITIDDDITTDYLGADIPGMKIINGSIHLYDASDASNKYVKITDENSYFVGKDVGGSLGVISVHHVGTHDLGKTCIKSDISGASGSGTKYTFYGVGGRAYLSDSFFDGQKFVADAGEGLEAATGGAKITSGAAGKTFTAYSGHATAACFQASDVSGTSRFIVQTDGAIYQNSSELHAASDENKKKDIVTIDNCLDKVVQLRPVSFKWKEEDMNDNTHFGLIAQEVQPIIPELVNEWIIPAVEASDAVLDEEGSVRAAAREAEEEKSNGLMLAYTELIPYLIGAVKELKAEVDALKA